MSERGQHDVSEDEHIRLVDIAGPESVIEGVTFKRCRLFGPAVLLLDGVTLDGVIAYPGDINTFLLEIKHPGVIPAGVILLVDCVLERCTYTNITIAGTGDEIAVLREHFF